MYVPVWLLVLASLAVVAAICHFYKLFRKWEALTVHNYRRWGKMKYEYECVADLLILDRDWLCHNLEPKLREELGKDFRVKWLNKPKYWEELGKHNQLFGPCPEYEEIRKLVYEHFREYKYLDVDDELSNYGVKMKRYPRDKPGTSLYTILRKRLFRK